MTSVFRSEGWIVRPSFVPHGPLAPVTLLGDEQGLTQLSGEPAVAWQTPWSELTNVQLVRFSRGLALFATADGVRYCWRTSNKNEYDALASVISQHGGRVVRRRRHSGIYAVVVVVLLASVAGGIGAYFSKGSASAAIIANTKAVNLSVRDLPSGWSASSGSLLSDLFGSAGKVITSTTVTTQPATDSTWAKVSALFEHCVGVSAEKDRMYGAAGQQPDYQVSSPVFDSSQSGGGEVASATQYYRTTTMVKRDTAEMRNTNFGACFVQTNAALLKSVYSSDVTGVPLGSNWQPVTFVKGFSRGGEEAISVPGVTGSLYLVMVQLTAGHYEVTLGALLGSWPAQESFVANLVNTLLSRMTSTTSAAV
ncbi:MAG TPA: hypothetical protein VGE75_00225 [Acidimicrobiales bacterium]